MGLPQLQPIAPEVPTIAAWSERSCPLCATGHWGLVAELVPADFCPVNFAYRENASNRLGIPPDTSFPLARCRACDFVYAKRLLSPALTHLVYEEIIDPDRCRAHSTSLTAVRESWRIWESLTRCVPEDLGAGDTPRVLDFGAGWGTFLSIARAPGVETVALETSPTRARHLRAQGFEVLESLEALETQAPFHVVCCNQVLEHVADPLDVLKALARVLHPRGVAYVSVPDFRPAHLDAALAARREGGQLPSHVNPWEHLNYFGPESLSTALRHAGLEPSPLPRRVPLPETTASPRDLLSVAGATTLSSIKPLLRRLLRRPRRSTTVLARHAEGTPVR